MSISYINFNQVKNAMRSSYNGADDTILLDQIIPACSAFLDKFTNRASGGFNTQTYDELYHGTGSNLLFLNNTPVQSISRIATTQLPALSVQNTDSDMAARATVKINGSASNQINLNSQNTSTGMTLMYVKGGVNGNQPITNTLTWASYPTVQSLADAINGLGNHWNATVMSGMGNLLSSDLRATQGAFGARIVTSYFWIHWFDLPIYRINENTGEIYSQQGFARGWGNWRVIYTAGYSTFPDDLTQALAELCAATYYAREVNGNLQSENFGPTGYTQLIEKTFDGLSLMAKKTFYQYKQIRIPKFNVW